MDFSNINYVYFLGIGGIGMSALARYFKEKSFQVAGYDKTPSVITEDLSRHEIPVWFDESLDALPAEALNKEHVLIIYTPAIPSNHPQLQYFIKENYQLLKRSEALGFIFNARNGIAVAGSHGKTSVSSLVSWILDGTEEGITAFIGGISKNFQSNLVNRPDSNWVLAEADEFDRSFHRLFPDITLITSIDSDHLDIYGTREAIVQSFNDFIAQIKEDGALIINARIEPEIEVDDSIEYYTYSTTEEADVQLMQKKVVDGKYYLDVALPNGEMLEDLEFNLPGDLNVENALAAITVAYLLDVSEGILRDRLASFSGVIRRFDYQLKTESIVYIDDYAHHPREISSTINAVREIYPGKKLTGIFQPHLFSRTRDLAIEFAEALDLLDEVILLDIYPARELPMEGVSSELIFNKLLTKEKYMVHKEQLMDFLKDKKYEVLVTMGAGDIDRLVPEIAKILTNR
ncbi:MAG: UDP-N-acetylmuramate--L-alanine ligase [Bacteroidales bacterium]|nr:UDP-N-acetylmuramate--L-alanine ligase [Bacteroidales bacterium]